MKSYQINQKKTQIKNGSFFFIIDIIRFLQINKGVYMKKVAYYKYSKNRDTFILKLTQYIDKDNTYKYILEKVLKLENEKFKKFNDSFAALTIKAAIQKMK